MTTVNNVFWEVQIQLVGLIGNVPNMMDLGASIGDATAYYRKHFPKCQVVSVEPLPGVAARLRERFSGQSRVHVIEAAVSDQIGETKFFRGGAKGSMSSMFPRPRYGINYYQHHLEPMAKKVRTTTVDAILKGLHIQTINLLKADVHGAELLMIRGGHKTFYNQRVDILGIEVLTSSVFDSNSRFHVITQTLEDYGYTFYNLYDRMVATDGQLMSADAIYVNASFRQKYLRGHKHG